MAEQTFVIDASRVTDDAEAWAALMGINLDLDATPVPNVIMFCKQLSFEARFMYTLLASYAWADRVGYVSMEELIKVTGEGSQGVIDLLAELIIRKAVKVEERNGRHAYVLKLPGIVDRTEEGYPIIGWM